MRRFKKEEKERKRCADMGRTENKSYFTSEFCGVASSPFLSTENMLKGGIEGKMELKKCPGGNSCIAGVAGRPATHR